MLNCSCRESGLQQTGQMLYGESKDTIFCHVERLQLKGLLYLMKERPPYAEDVLKMGKIGKEEKKKLKRKPALHFASR